MSLEIEGRHSDWGDDAGGYRILRFNGDWIGRVTDYEACDKLLAYVRGLEKEKVLLYEWIANNLTVEQIKTVTKYVIEGRDSHGTDSVPKL